MVSRCFSTHICGTTNLVHAAVSDIHKRGYFTFGCAALFYLLYVLVWEARRHANALGKDVGRAFLICGSLTSVLWTLYPIAWGICEGGNVIAPDSEAIFYGILDVLAKPVFGALLIWGHRGIDPTRLGLYIHDYDEKDPAAKVEKNMSPAGATGSNFQPNGHSNGTATNHDTGITSGSDTV